MNSLLIVDESGQAWQMVPYAEFSSKHLLWEDGCVKFNRAAKSKLFADGQVLSMGYFYHRIIHHRVQPSFWSRPFSLLSSSSFLPSLLSLPFFFLFLFYFLCSYPREVCKRNRNYDFFLGGIGNKFREINPKMVCEYKVSVGWGNPTCILTGGETSQSVAHWRWGLPGRLPEARLLPFFPVFSKASYFRFYSFNSMGILVFVHIVNISTYLGGEGYHCIQVNWHLVFLFYFLIVR